ncbi:MAG: hypothetical protein JWM53_6722 [bacterium]|nr:hypothetical protein [bacterium]
MSDERKRRDEWAGLLNAWPAPRPSSGFADRVLAACEASAPLRLTLVREPPSRRPALSGLFVCVAIAAAVVLIPFALHKRQPPANAASVASIGTSFDLGPEHD